MVILDATVVNVALPSIQADLGFSRREPAVGDQQLHADVRRLPAARRARRRPVRAAAAVPLGRRDLLVASLLNGLATSDTWLVATRGLQGLGGALVSPAALSIITTTFAEGEDRTKALGVWSAIAAGGGAFGLLLGGMLTDLLSWEWIFFVNVPIGIATAMLAIRYVPESRGAGAGPRHRPARRDHGDRRASSCSSTRSSRPRTSAGARPARSGSPRSRSRCSPRSCSSRAAARAPLIRLGIFKVRSLAGANAVLLLVVGGLFAFFFFSSLYVQQILGYSPLEAGLAFLPVTVGIGARRGDRAAARQADRRPHHGRGRHAHRGVRALPVLARDRRRHLPERRAPGRHPAVDRHGPVLRADHADRDDERRARRTPGSPRACSTRRSRSAARSGSRCSRRSPPTSPPACSPTSATRRSQVEAAERAARRLPGRVHRRGDPRRVRRGAADAAGAQGGRREREPDAAPVPGA